MFVVVSDCLSFVVDARCSLFIVFVVWCVDCLVMSCVVCCLGFSVWCLLCVSCVVCSSLFVAQCMLCVDCWLLCIVCGLLFVE